MSSSGTSLVPDIARRISRIRRPTNYFRGTPPLSLETPRNVLLFCRRSPEDLGFGHFRHYRYVLVVNVKTEGTVLLDDAMYRFAPGQALLIHPFQHHRFLNLQDKDLAWLFITFELSAIDAISMLRSTPVALSDDAWVYVDLLTRLHGPSLPGDIATTDRIVHLVALVLSECMRASSIRAPATSVTDAGSGKLVDRAHRYIYAHVHTPFTVTHLARELGTSESNLRAVYRREIGASLGKSILSIRMLKAASYLAHSEMNITEIAEACGYESLFVFSRAFKQYHGVSPRLARKTGLRAEGKGGGGEDTDR
jgi:AraC-like DNA-binding protein